MAKLAEQDLWQEVPSPFAGTGDDDLTISVTGSTIEVKGNASSIDKERYEQPLGDISPQINGQAASLEQAVAKAAELINTSRQPLIGGLATDVNGMRAALNLAETSRAVVDKNNSHVSMRNLNTLQTDGWMLTTLSEVKNRADLIVVVGSDVEKGYPRFFERHVWPDDAIFIESAQTRKVIYLGKQPSGTAAHSPAGVAPKVLACADEELPLVIATLAALIKKKPVRGDSVAGIAISELQALADALLAASYSAIVWSAAELNFAESELTIQRLCSLIKDLNLTTRSGGIPLGAKDGDFTAMQVSAWISGYPCRFSYAKGYPDYDRYLLGADDLLKAGDIDALVWVSAFDCNTLPPASAASTPSIVIGRCGMQFEQAPAVYIPVGVPGIDHSGHAYRCDGVVAIRLQQLRDSELPSSADVLSAIEQAL